MFVVRHGNIFIIISTVVVASSLLAILLFGFNVGIDFTGGSLIEASYPQGRPGLSELKKQLDALDLGDYRLQPTGENGYLLRLRSLTEQERQPILDAFSLDGNFEFKEERFTSIGPVIGKELKNKAIIAIILVVIAIILFVAFAFRKVSHVGWSDIGSVSSWKYGVVAIVALLHDIAVPVGVFVLLGRFLNVEIDILFVTALLAILGYSVNDTIVVFDRIRENLRLNKEYRRRQNFDETVGESLKQTYVRSINTSLTTLFVLLTLFFMGGDSTKYFSLALLIGVVAGTYSSIFLASPLLVVIAKRQIKKTN
jgi:preprotein translocase subunit SecF